LDNFKVSLKKSSLAFEKHFKKAVLEVFKGEIEIVEGITKDKMALTLDRLAGIDLWYFNTKMGVRGVANRIQFGGKCWATFTVRKSRASGAKTECEKRKYAMENGWLYPILTLQGYLDGDRVLGFAIAKTEDIMWMIDKGHSKVRKTGKAQVGQAEFYVVTWANMQEHNKNIYIHRREGVKP